MNQYIVALILFSLFYAMFMCITYLIGNRDVHEIRIRKRGKRDLAYIQKKRHSHTEVEKTKIEKFLEGKVTVSKKYKIETMCLQAGYNLSYADFKMLSIVIAVILPIIMFFIMKNIYLAAIFAFIGYHVPGQAFKMIANKRVIKMENQIGSFLRLVIERYKRGKDLAQAIVQTLPDFRGHEPFYKELKKTVVDIDLGIPSEETLDDLARRTGNRFLNRFCDYYKITSKLEMHEEKVELLNQAYLQYEENRQMKNILKKEIAGPVREAYIMVIATPAFMLYQSITTDGYLDFMLHEKIGQMGIAGVILVLLGCIWFINAKIGAPIE